MTDRAPLGQSVPGGQAAPEESGKWLMAGNAGLRTMTQHSDDMELADAP